MSASSSKPVRPLWFEPFLQQVKRQLGYPFDLGKYGQLLQWSQANSWTKDEEPFGKLYAVCRMLFLQNYQHEEQFREMFRDYVLAELDAEKKRNNPEPVPQPVPPSPVPSSDVQPIPDPLRTTNPVNQDSEFMNEPADEATAVPPPPKKYLNLTIPLTFEKDEINGIKSASGSRFLLNDSYLPLTVREMIHGWRHLRKKTGYRQGKSLNVLATVQQIAREGLMLQPVFEKEAVNSENLLLILADRGGSMTPFHRLTDKLIETAVKDGGHKGALVYYFYNCPGDFVFKDTSLSQPVALSHLYSEMQPLHTNALIISDGGAARGNLNKDRALKTLEFLYGGIKNNEVIPGLHKAANLVSWLNPMPVHRWPNTTASYIDHVPGTPMYSVMEEGHTNFLAIIEKLMGS
jgi:hypothetical protein